MCPNGVHRKEIESIYKGVSSWEINRNKILDVKAIFSLRSHLKNVDSKFHCFTLKTGILFCLANLFLKIKIKQCCQSQDLVFCLAVAQKQNY